MTVIHSPESVFLSYARTEGVEAWVSSVFEPLLRERLPHEGGIVGGLTVFRDAVSIEPGEAWTSRLEAALAAARVMVVVGSPEYFYRPWCRVEFFSMLGRQARTGHNCIVPVRYSDGDYYIAEARALQWEDFRAHTYERSARTATKACRQAIRDLSKLIGERVRTATDDPGWVLERPAPQPMPTIAKPTLNDPWSPT